MIGPREDGLSSDEEFKTLLEIEDQLQEHITSQHNSIYIGRLTTDGRRDYYFYAGDTMLYDKTISDAMVAYPLYSFEFGIKDRDWKLYLDFMYPNRRQFESIQNRRVIDILEKKGDKLIKARPVYHWIYFKSDGDRNLFLSKIEHLGFDIIGMDETTSFGKFPYKLVISRINMVDWKSVDGYVLELCELARECNGNYDGLETSVEME
jgi:hypothetical protein